MLGGWDSDNRPVPAGVRLVGKAGPSTLAKYDAVIGHAPSDLRLLLRNSLASRTPFVYVLHGNIRRVGVSGGRLRDACKRTAKRLGMRRLLKALELTGLASFVFISEYDKRGWGVEGAVIDHGIPVSEMYPYSGEQPMLLTVGNALDREHFDLAAILRVRELLPLQIIGNNAGIDGSRPSRDWDDLRTMYRDCRAYLNFTREPERGYTLCTLEAMASGMPVVTLRHPVSPIVDGFNGFVVDEAETMVKRARLLLEDAELARRLGQNARRTVIENFGIERFVAHWNRVLHAVVRQREQAT